MDPHRIGLARSLAYHRVVAERLDQATIDAARALVARWIAEGRAVPYVERWRALLDGPRDLLIKEMTASDEEAATLRSCSPFAGALDAKERWRLWAAVRAELESP